MDQRIVRLERWALRRRRGPRRYVVEYVQDGRRWVAVDRGDPTASEEETLRVTVEYVREPLPGHDQGGAETPP